MTFWFFPLPRLIFMLAPLLHIFFDIKIFVSNVDEAIAYTATYIVVNVMMQNYLYGRVRWPWMSELYEYVQGVFLSRPSSRWSLSPRKPTFNVTAKGLTLDNDHLSRTGAGRSSPSSAILLAGGLTAAYRYMFEPGVDEPDAGRRPVEHVQPDHRRRRARRRGGAQAARSASAPWRSIGAACSPQRRRDRRRDGARLGRRLPAQHRDGIVAAATERRRQTGRLRLEIEAVGDASSRAPTLPLRLPA